MSLDVRPDHLKIVLDILNTHVPDREVWAFGSRVTGSSKETSDLDLAIIGETPLDFGTLASLRDAFSESRIPYKVDVVDWSTIGETFKNIILKNKIVIKKNIEVKKIWPEFPLEKCMSTIIDYRGKTPRKSTSGIPLITAKIIKAGRIEKPTEFIDQKEYIKWISRGISEPGDIVVTTEAPLGEVAQLNSQKVALAQRVITLRGKNGFLDNTFLKFLMQSDYIQDQLKSRATGTTVVGIRQSEIRKIWLPLPPLHEQRAIAHILGTLDDKIELNRRMNETLEAMARAIFKSWFVDFDPVRAKAEGRDTGLPKEIADLFPDGFEESELGKIPRGWKIGELCDLAVQKRRNIQPTKIEAETPYIGLEHMPRKSIALSEWAFSESIESNKFEFNKGDILFGKLRAYFHKVGVAPVNGVCSTDILVISPIKNEWFGFVLSHVSSDSFVEYTDLGASGTRMPRTNWDHMKKYPLIVPSINVSEIFTSKISSLIGKLIENVHASKTLAGLRDTLLPKLLSGEIRVKDAEEYSELVL